MGRRPAHAPLRVYLNARLVGRLRRESSGAIDFQYDAEWLAWNNAIPVSISLPLREDRYIGDPVLAVFENLLPDNDDIRRRIALQCAAKDLGGISIGAVTLGCYAVVDLVPEARVDEICRRSRSIEPREIVVLRNFPGKYQAFVDRMKVSGNIDNVMMAEAPGA